MECHESLLLVPKSVRTSILQWVYSFELTCHPHSLIQTSLPPSPSSSLISTWDHCPSSSTRLPCPSGTALVGRRSTHTMDFRGSSYSSSLHPFGSIGLLLSSSSFSVLTSYRLNLWSTWLHLGPSASWSSGVTRSLCLLGSDWVSTSPGSTSVDRVSGSILAPPSFISAMGLHPNGSSQGQSLVCNYCL